MRLVIKFVLSFAHHTEYEASAKSYSGEFDIPQAPSMHRASCISTESKISDRSRSMRRHYLWVQNVSTD